MATNSRRNGDWTPQSDESAATQALNDAWNARVRRASATDADLDPEFLAAIDEIINLAGEPRRPRRTFISQLENDIMHPSTDALTLPKARIAIPSAIRRSAPTSARNVSRTRATGVALTFAAAIVLILSLVNPFGNGPDHRPPSTVPAIALAPSSPIAGGTGSPIAQATMEAIIGDQSTVNNRSLGSASIGPSSSNPGLGSAGIGEAPYHSTLTKWSLRPGETVEFSSDLVGTTPGVAVDVVISGTERIAFNGEFVVYPAQRVVGGAIHYGRAGETVEVERGDTVVYRYDRRRSVTNALQKNDLQILTFILTAADSKPTIPSTAAFSEAVLGEGTSPIGLSGRGDLSIQFFVWSAISRKPLPPLSASHAVYAIEAAPIDPHYKCCYYYNVIVTNDFSKG